MAEHRPQVSDSTHAHTEAWMENDVFPWLGRRPIAEIDAPEILAVLKRIDGRGARHTAHKVRSKIGQVFRYGIKEGFCKSDPARDLVGAIPTPSVTHMAVITDLAQVGAMLRAFDAFSGTYTVACALKLAPMLFVRPGELRKAEWSEFDFDRAVWSIPADKMKMRWPHQVPLSRQVLELLDEIRPLTGHSPYVFPACHSWKRPMSENTITFALRRMGYSKDQMTAHGFRAMAATLLNEMGI